MRKVAIELQQTKPFRVLVGVGIELQFLRIIQRTTDPLAIAAPHRQTIGVVDLRVNGVTHAALVIAAGKHAGHRRNTQLLDVLTGIQMVFDIHDHLGLLAMDHELIGTGDARAVQQGVDRKGGCARFDGFKPEGGEVRELFLAIGIGVQRQAARG